MTVKISGEEFSRFYKDPKFWPKDVWHEDEEISINGYWAHDIKPEPDLCNVSNTDMLTLRGGIVLGLPDGSEPSMESYFKKWRKEQTTTTLVVECSLKQLVAVKESIKTAGGRVIT